MSLEGEINDRRREIDAIDDQLLRLLNQRAALASQLLRLKRNAGLAVCDPQRESDVVMRARSSNHGPLDGSAVEAIFRCIVTEVRKAEEAENARLTAEGTAR
ncbi:MAG: chorismate mutase [Terriglobales bacterium]